MINTWMMYAGLQESPIKAHEPVSQERKTRTYKKNNDYLKTRSLGHKHRLILELFKSGQSIDQIKDRLLTSAQYVRNILFYHNLIDFKMWAIKRCNEKPVIVRKETGEFVGEYRCVMEAARETGVSDWTVRKCCKEKNKSIRGFVFEYKQARAR